MAKNRYEYPCNIARTLNKIGDKWTLLILHEILVGKETYKEIQDKLDGIPSNLLSQRLKSLEEEGLLTLELYQSHPPRYKYRLTESGLDLRDVFSSLIIWGEKHLRPCYKTLVHQACNHKITQQYHCPHCDRVVGYDDIAAREKSGV